MSQTKENLFARLKRLFQTGPLIKRKIRGAEVTPKLASSALDLFKKSQAHVYNNALASYGQFDRMCLELHTKIAIPGKEKFKTLQELIDQYPNGEKFIVYAYDHEKKCVVPAWAHHPRITDERETVKIIFDDGNELICTPDHPCMMRDGTFKDAGQLQRNDSMMPFYRKQFNGRSKKDGKRFDGYYSILTWGLRSYKNWEPEHRLIAEWYSGKNIQKDTEHVHHMNYDSSDNNPKNLKIMDAFEHLSLHGNKITCFSGEEGSKFAKDIQLKAWKYDAENGGKRKANLISYNKDPKTRELRKETFLNNNPSKRKDVQQKMSDKRHEEMSKKKNRFFQYSREKLWDIFQTECNSDFKKLAKYFTTNESVIKNWFTTKSLELDILYKIALEYDFNQKRVRENFFDIRWETLITFLRSNGFKSWNEFCENYYFNHKVVSVIPWIKMKVGDLTVDGYENFATDTIFCHNSRYADFCFKGDTLIYTTQGAFTIKELSEKYPDGQRFHVYSYDHEQKKIVIGTAHDPRIARNGEECELVKVVLDDGGYLITTPDHKFMLRDGSYLEAEKLSEGVSLMPCYIRTFEKDGYPYVYTLKKGEGYRSGWVRQHRFHIEELVRKLKPNEVVHHKDFNKLNPSLENLEIMDEDKHHRYHAQLNNKNKYGKSNNSHSSWMYKNNVCKRDDVNFDRILELAIEYKFVCKDVVNALDADLNVIKRHLRKFGFKNWIDFSNRREEAQRIKTDQVIIQETKSPEIEDILQNSHNCETIYELAQKLNCSENAIRRRLESHGYGTWSKFRSSLGNGDTFNPGQVSKDSAFDKSITYQQICNVYKPGMSMEEIGQSLGVSKNKVFTRICREGFKSYTDWIENYQNHKVSSVERLERKEQVYNLTVEKYHNFAAGSVNPSSETSNERPQSLVFIRNSEMEYSPIISAALDIYSEESAAQDDKGRSLHVYSNNPQIKKLLEELFYDTLNVEFNLRPWVRNLVKYGDFFLFNDVSPEYGIINVFPVPVNEIEREEGFNPEDPLAVRYRWVTQGNQVLDNWQITHFRLLGNDSFLPYGSSLVEPARRVWRQLILAEDSMLSYRVVRSPERRVFYIDVGNVPPEEVPNYLEQAKQALRTNSVIDKSTGKLDLRFNSINVLDDYFIPVRGSESGTKIETLPGGQNTTATEDVEYFKSLLISALKVPRAYLGFDDMLASKATLAQEDIRFSRTINMIQRVIIAELNKIASIHLFSNGYDQEDLLNFVLHLSNPSTIAQQQKLELYRAKFEIASSVPENLVDLDYLRRNILGMTNEDIKRINKGLEVDRKIIAKLEGITSEESLGGPVTGEKPAGGEEGTDQEAGGEEELFAHQFHDEALLTSNDEAPIKPSVNSETNQLDEDDDTNEEDNDGEKEKKDVSGSPIKANSVVGKYHYNRKRARHHGSNSTNTPDYNKMLSGKNSSLSDPFDKPSLGIGSPFKFGSYGEGKQEKSQDDILDEFWTKKELEQTRMTSELKSAINRLEKHIGSKISNKTQITPRSVVGGLLTENIQNNEELENFPEIEEDTEEN